MQNNLSRRSVVIDPRRSGFKWSVAVGLVLMVLAALFVSTMRATSAAVGDGIAFADSEAALGANDLALKALSQAVLLAEDNALGVADVNTLTLAMQEADSTLDDLITRTNELVESSGSGAVKALAADAATSGRAVLQHITAGEIDLAGTVLSGPTIESFELLRDEISRIRASQEAAVRSSGAGAARLGDLVTFLGLFLLPLGAVLVYRYAARKQLRNAEVHLDARLDAEREVMRAKDEFIGNISHELRTPLTSIFGFSEVLLESGAVDAATTLDLIGLINYESGELTRMVEDLLVSARLESNALTYTYETVDVSAEAGAVLETMRYDDRTIECEFAAVECWADPVRVRQILRNLLSNARRYGGSTIRVSARRDGNMLRLIVADSGQGVPEDMEPRLFTKYVHGGNDALMAGSVGLGLAVVGSITAAMGGEVGYEHEDGWTRFVVKLPLTEGDKPVRRVDSLEEESAVHVAYLRRVLGEGIDHGIAARADK